MSFWFFFTRKQLPLLPCGGPSWPPRAARSPPEEAQKRPRGDLTATGRLWSGCFKRLFLTYASRQQAVGSREKPLVWRVLRSSRLALNLHDSRRSPGQSPEWRNSKKQGNEHCTRSHTNWDLHSDFTRTPVALGSSPELYAPLAPSVNGE